jgi:hypothetical protein
MEGFIRVDLSSSFARLEVMHEKNEEATKSEIR